jgi:hypothetical protein
MEDNVFKNIMYLHDICQCNSMHNCVLYIHKMDRLETTTWKIAKLDLTMNEHSSKVKLQDLSCPLYKELFLAVFMVNTNFK